MLSRAIELLSVIFYLLTIFFVFGILYLRDVIYRRQVVSSLGRRDDGVTQLRLQLLASGLGHTASFLGYLGALYSASSQLLTFNS